MLLVLIVDDRIDDDASSTITETSGNNSAIFNEAHFLRCHVNTRASGTIRAFGESVASGLYPRCGVSPELRLSDGKWTMRCDASVSPAKLNEKYSPPTNHELFPEFRITRPSSVESGGGAELTALMPSIESLNLTQFDMSC